MAAATLTPPATEKAYLPLLRLLAEKDFEALAALPKALQDPALLGPAWADGVIEFGRLNHTETGVPSADSIAHKRHTILEEGYGWSGAKKVHHKQIRALLAEDDALPTNCVLPVIVKDHDKGTQRVTYKASGNDALRLRVRLTDKGLAVLAG